MHGMYIYEIKLSFFSQQKKPTRNQCSEGKMGGKSGDPTENVRGFDFAATEKRLSRQQWKLNCAAYKKMGGLFFR